MNWPVIDWRHDNTGRLFYDSTRRFQEGVLALVNQAGFGQIEAQVIKMGLFAFTGAYSITWLSGFLK